MDAFDWSVVVGVHVCLFVLQWHWRGSLCVNVCVCVREGGASEWVFVCNHVRQAIMNGVFETAECGVPRAGPNWKQKNKHSLESPALHLPYP